KFFEGADIGEPRVGKSKLFRLLHTKTLIIDGQEGPSASVVTGSANFSATAFESNRENLIFLDSPVVANAFFKSFHRFAPANRDNRETYCPAIWTSVEEEVPHPAGSGESDED